MKRKGRKGGWFGGRVGWDKEETDKLLRLFFRNVVVQEWAGRGGGSGGEEAWPHDTEIGLTGVPSLLLYVAAFVKASSYYC